MAIYYARAVVKSTTTPQPISIQAHSLIEAKRIIEGRLGEIKRWVNSPAATSSPPHWYASEDVPTYYARAVVKNTTTPQPISVQARSLMEAKRMIEGRLGEIVRWANPPAATAAPPPWYASEDVPTYYARAVVKDTTTRQPISVQARSLMEAKRMIEGRLGEIKRWVNSPAATRNPPSWYE